MPTPQEPPVAQAQPHQHTEHGVPRSDPYHWMRVRDTPELLAHLTAERRWYDSATAHLSSLVETLSAEMTARVAPTDLSVSWRRRHSYYYTRHPAGSNYQQLIRESRRSNPSGPQESAPAGPGDNESGRPEVLLDAGLLADDSGYLELGLTLVSPNERLLAYSFDRVGDEVYLLRFRNLDTGVDLDEEIPRSYYGGAWSADSRLFFYTVHDDLYRPHEVWRHEVGTSARSDVLVVTEPDERFGFELEGSRSGDLVVVTSLSRDTTEVWTIDAHHPDAMPRSVGGRRPGVEYRAEHLRLSSGEDMLLLVTNDGATEYRLASAPVPREADQEHTTWSVVRPEDPAERLEEVAAFATHVVLTLRTDSHRMLRVLPVDALDSAGLDLLSRFEVGTIAVGTNEEYDAPVVTVCEQSYVQPAVWSDITLATGGRSERHHQEAPGHDPSAYLCERRTLPSPDGTDVPVTLVRHRDTPLDGTAPALMYAYGAYEWSYEPEWDPALPSLLDRGVVYAHAHVRGGGEGGRRWWLDGHLAKKQNTFTDHLAVADGLDGVVDGSRIATRGLSAGGLLQAAVFSQRPDRWRAVVAEVPFVDVVTTMFDASIPLTINEWEEWGDPRERDQFDWLLAYSPYDNLPPAGQRPDLFVTAALHDPRVPVWEPAKWVAALRASDPAWSPRCLFRCEVGAGSHVGPSGRFGHLSYEAEIYAWVIDRLIDGLTS